MCSFTLPDISQGFYHLVKGNAKATSVGNEFLSNPIFYSHLAKVKYSPSLSTKSALTKILVVWLD